MPTYVSLIKWTDQGITRAKEAPQRMAAVNEKVEAMGGKTIAFYALMGEYDFLRIEEFPSDEVAVAFLLWVSSLGTVRTTTMKAFSAQEFTEMVRSIL
jgi:uncharacterized protein with GYD domain